MTLGGPEIRDHAKGNRIAWIIIPALLIPLALAFFKAGTGTVLASFPAAALAGTMLRGKKEIVQPNKYDHTFLVQQWTRPPLMVYICCGGIILCAVAAFGLMFGDLVSGHGPSGWAWLVSLPLWFAAAGGAAWFADRTRAAQTVQHQEANPTTYEEQLLQLVTTQFFITAKLTDGNITPVIESTGLDDWGNPYYIAHAIAGRQPLSVWEKAAPNLASAWGVEKVTVTQDRVNVIRVTVPLHTFTRTEPVKWVPPFDRNNPPPVTEYLRGLKFGEQSRSSDPWFLPLRSKGGGVHCIIAGATGAGKGGFVKVLLANLAWHPDIEIYGVDIAKVGAEFADWEPRMSAVATTRDEAEQMLIWLKADMEATYAQFPAHETTNAWNAGRGGRPPMLGNGFKVKVLLIDESNELLNGGVGKEQNDQIERITDLIATMNRVGRASGHVDFLATQRPNPASIPSALTANMLNSVAFRMKESYGASCALGESWSKSPAAKDPETNPVDILTEEQGVAIVSDGEGDYQRVQCAWIADDEVPDIVAACGTARKPNLNDLPVAPGTARPAGPGPSARAADPTSSAGPAADQEKDREKWDAAEALRKRREHLRAVEDPKDDEPTEGTQPRADVDQEPTGTDGQDSTESRWWE